MLGVRGEQIFDSSQFGCVETITDQQQVSPAYAAVVEQLDAALQGTRGATTLGRHQVRLEAG